MMKQIMERLMDDYNEYSRLVAISAFRTDEGTCDEGTLQWNRGKLAQTADYLDELTRALGVKIQKVFGVHTFGKGEEARDLRYCTVHIEAAELTKLG